MVSEIFDVGFEIVEWIDMLLFLDILVVVVIFMGLGTIGFV